jgi:hypothetical protein
MKKKNKRDPEIELEYIIIDEQARVFSGLKEGYPVFSDNIDEAKPLKYQEAFNHMKRYHYNKLEQMFLEDGREKRKHRKTKISI